MCALLRLWHFFQFTKYDKRVSHYYILFHFINTLQYIIYSLVVKPWFRGTVTNTFVHGSNCTCAALVCLVFFFFRYTPSNRIFGPGIDKAVDIVYSLHRYVGDRYCSCFPKLVRQFELPAAERGLWCSQNTLTCYLSPYLFLPL